MSVYFVIFGAAVRDDGTPSGTLRRRVEGALAAAQGVNMARYMPTGGARANGHIEADVIKELLLRAGIPADAIISEREARDTLDSVRRCDALLRAAAALGFVYEFVNAAHSQQLVRVSLDSTTSSKPNMSLI